MKPRIYLLAFLFCFSSLQAQTSGKDHYYSLAVSNAHTAKPFENFSSLFYKDFHPGFEGGYGSILKTAKKHVLFAELKLSYLFHRWVQHNIALNLFGGYGYKLNSSWTAAIKFGGGYQASIPTGKVFRITENGPEEKGHALRSQFTANLGFIVDKRITSTGTKLFMEYRQIIQTPFVKEYVPLLPYNQILIGLTFPVQ
jgi:hypothetical protein